MGGISKSTVRVPRWLKRIERAEYRRQRSWLSKLIRVKPAADLDAALRESDRRLRWDASFFAVTAAVELLNVWLDGRGEQAGRWSSCANMLPFVWIFFSDAIGSTDRWLGVLMHRANNPGGVGPEWVARQGSIRRRHRLEKIPPAASIVVIVATIPVTHALYHPHAGDVSRIQVELSTIAVMFLLDALSFAVGLRRVNRRCFATVCTALYAAEAELAAGQAPGAGAGAIEDAEPSDAISWVTTG
ncbi:hypothetical protein KDL01_02160 [Actinospica durhamensis]|uniref:Uncharacterized protein n=1 Tax=Actinospica durhamensis TaxID=1508375 RepID=A0A941EJL5_9ACTN|nr:hypothetical protein [Actinospica durhamensis]MBR7832043.1 hypothetical protein [Actinospica durhamensis]